MPMPSPNTDQNTARYFLALGAAAANLWSDLPAALQQTLFERAVLLGHQSERDESLREQLAKFLHDHHGRTQTR
jgi:glucose-6-phosphate-specific signal transduction histidine kinase